MLVCSFPLNIIVFSSLQLNMLGNIYISIYIQYLDISRQIKHQDFSFSTLISLFAHSPPLPFPMLQYRQNNLVFPQRHVRAQGWVEALYL